MPDDPSTVDGFELIERRRSEILAHFGGRPTISAADAVSVVRMPGYLRNVLADLEDWIPPERRADDWPTTPSVLSRQLRKAAHLLRGRGIRLVFWKRPLGIWLRIRPVAADVARASPASDPASPASDPASPALPPDAGEVEPSGFPPATADEDPFEDSILDEARPERRSPNGDDDEENPFTDEVLGLAPGETPRSPNASPASLLVDPALPGENPFEDYEDLLPPGWGKKS